MSTAIYRTEDLTLETADSYALLYRFVWPY